jgi:hypothetical protein
MEQSEQRQLLPGLLYRLPPSQDKADFLALGSEGRLALWREAPPDAAPRPMAAGQLLRPVASCLPGALLPGF